MERGCGVAEVPSGALLDELTQAGQVLSWSPPADKIDAPAKQKKTPAVGDGRTLSPHPQAIAQTSPVEPNLAHQAQAALPQPVALALWIRLPVRRGTTD